jgi:hypothetical protein
MAHFNDSRTSVPQERTYRLRLLGANGAAPTIQEGTLCGITATRTGEGAYELTWSATQNPGKLIGWHATFGAATPADCAGYTAVRDTLNTTTRVLPFVVYNSSFAAADIIADQYLDITLVFSQSGLTS